MSGQKSEEERGGKERDNLDRYERSLSISRVNFEICCFRDNKWSVGSFWGICSGVFLDGTSGDSAKQPE